MNMALPCVIASAAFAVAGTWLLYRMSPQQQWGSRAAPSRIAGISAGLLLILSLGLILPFMGTGAAIFSWLTVVMLVATLAPFIGAWRARSRKVAR